MIKNKNHHARAGSGAIPTVTAAVLALGAMAAHGSADYGPAIWRPICNANWYTSGYGKKFYVIHDMEGYYASVLSAFAGCGYTSASVHYAVNGKKDASSDYAAGEVTQLGVADANYAWHACCWNQHSMGTEHEGFASNPAWYTPELYASSAALTASKCDKYGFARDRNHIVGHEQGNPNLSQWAAWRSWAGGNLGINASCQTHTDPGGYWDWNGYMAQVNPAPVTNPPYYFDANSQGWTAGNGICCGVGWNGTQWPGVMFMDQNANDAFVYGPASSFGGGGNALVNVMVYPQNGTTANHDMQLFWKTTGENFWDAPKSSPLVTYNRQNAWINVNLDVNSPKWAGQTINQLRLDFDNGNSATRWIVNHVVLQSSLRWYFDNDTMQWTAGNNVAAPWWIGPAGGWPGCMVVDQTGNDAGIVASQNWFNLAGPLHYIGGANDRIHVRIYPQNGSTANHDMQVYWITDVDGAWSESKSTYVTYSAQNAWADVYLPVGSNPAWPDGHITQIRLDFDNVNHGNRWIIDYVGFEY